MQPSDRLRESRARFQAARTRSAANVVLVTGPPCSGKTTYVQQHRGPADIVIDYDAIAVALGSPDSHQHPPALRPFILDARDAVIDRIHREQGTTAWLIAARPTAADLQMASRIVELAVPAEECKRRARADGRPAFTDRYIDDWWAARAQPV